MIEIEYNVPLTPHERGRESKYPLHSMNTGDSFFTSESRVKFNGSIAHAQRKLGYKFATRKAEKDGQSGYRVWRTA